MQPDLMPTLAVLEPALNIAKSVLGIGGLIFVHELGHFLVGRWSGVRAEAFSIGFGPVLWKWTPGPTEYRLSAIPLGGYVKFLGEIPGEEGGQEPDSFEAAPYWRKAAILVAGVTMNVVAALVLFVSAFSIGIDRPAPVVGGVRPGSAAWEFGLERHDELVSVDGDSVTDFQDFKEQVFLSPEIELVVRRGGELLPALRIQTHEGPGGIRVLGVDSSFRMVVTEGSKAWNLGLRTDDEIVATDGRDVTHDLDVVRTIAAPGNPIVWTVSRDGERHDVEMPLDDEALWLIGVDRDSPTIEAVRRESPAWEAGLRPGDVPVSMGERPTPTLFSLKAALRDPSVPGPVLVERNGKRVEIPVAGEGAPRTALANDIESGPDEGTYVSPSAVFEGGSPMAAAGMVAGSRILTVDDTSIASFTDLAPLVAEAGKAGRALSITWRGPDGADVGPVDVRPVERRQAAEVEGLAMEAVLVEVRGDGVMDSVARGIVHTHRTMVRILSTLRSLISADVSPTNLAGPVAIADVAYKTAKTSWGEFYLFLGMISMNLAVLNILPIPLLDGGQLMMHTAEKVRGEPLRDAVLEGIQWVGLVFLLGLMVFVITNDIVRIGS